MSTLITAPALGVTSWSGFVSFHHHPDADAAEILAQTLQRAVDSGVLAAFEIGTVIPHPSNPVDRTPINVKLTVREPVLAEEFPLWDWLNWDGGLPTWYGRVNPEILER